MLLQSDLNSLYIETKYNSKEEITDNIFSTYVEPLLNDINNPALVQEWKLNLDAPEYEKKLMLTWIDVQIKIEIDNHDIKTYWPIIKKEMIQWFPSHSIRENTAGITKTDMSWIPSLLKVFEIF